MTRKGQITLAFTHDLRIIVNGRVFGRAVHPYLCNRELMTRRVKGRVDGFGNDQRILWSQLMRFFIIGLSALELLLGGVKIAQSKICDVVVGVEFSEAQEIFLS